MNINARGPPYSRVYIYNIYNSHWRTALFMCGPKSTLAFDLHKARTHAIHSGYCSCAHR